MQPKKSHRIGGLLLLCLAVGFFGCEGKPEIKGKPAEDSQHILRAIGIWGQYREKYKKGPKSLEDLKTWAKAEMQKDKDRFPEVKDIDKALTSERDGKPYAVVPGATFARVVLYEQDGKDGSRQVVSFPPSFSLLGEDEFRKLVPK